MDNIIIQVHANRKLSKKTVDIGNMLENKVTKLIFELDEDIVALGGNVYLFVSYDGASYPYPLTDNTLTIGRELTQRKRSDANIVVSTSEDADNILDGAVWISNTLILLADKNSINMDAINEQELPPSLQIVYDKLLNLQKELEAINIEDEIHWFTIDSTRQVTREKHLELYRAYNAKKILILEDAQEKLYAVCMGIGSGMPALLFMAIDKFKRMLIYQVPINTPIGTTVTVDTYKLPTKLSQLEDDITSALEKKIKDFVYNEYVNWDEFFNMYDNELATKEQLNQAISTIPKFDIKVVSELPTSNISSTTVYLLPSGEETNDIYTEYIYVNGKWEKLGTQRLDMSNYYTKTEIDQKLGTYVDEMAELLGGDA